MNDHAGEAVHIKPIVVKRNDVILDGAVVLDDMDTRPQKTTGPVAVAFVVRDPAGADDANAVEIIVGGLAASHDTRADRDSALIVLENRASADRGADVRRENPVARVVIGRAIKDGSAVTDRSTRETGTPEFRETRESRLRNLKALSTMSFAMVVAKKCQASLQSARGRKARAPDGQTRAGTGSCDCHLVDQ